MVSLIPIRWSLLFLVDPLYWWVIFFNRDSTYYELDTWSEDIFVSPRSTSLSWSTARTKREVGRCPTWLRRMLKEETLLCLFRAKKISSIWALMVSDESFQNFKPGLHWGWWLRCWAYSGCKQHLPGICLPPGNNLFCQILERVDLAQVVPRKVEILYLDLFPPNCCDDGTDVPLVSEGGNLQNSK